MTIVTQAKATQDLEDHFDALEVIVRGAWDDVASLPSPYQIVMGARSRASLVHDFMLSRAAVYADGNPDVRYFERQAMHGLVIGGRYAIRFKKFDEDNRSKNHPTAQVTEFRGQVELDGIDAAHHLEVGYITDALGTEVADVRVTCPSGQGNAWAISISGRTSSTVLADIFPADGGPSGTEIKPADIKPRAPEGQILPFERKTDK